MLLREHVMASSRRIPIWGRVAIVLGLIAAMAWVRLMMARDVILPIGYGVPLVLIALLRSRRLLWGSAIAFAIIAIFQFALFHPAPPKVPLARYQWIACLLVLVDLLLVTVVVHLWLVTQESGEHQFAQLESANADLVTREEEIARTNEELQSQTEELERQSEELRVANEELARREKTLQILLDLSRSLTTELSGGETMTRICETLGQLVNGLGTAAAILEKEGDRLVVRCHHGFGPAGLVSETLPVEQSFGALVLARGRTGYLEDVALRPDLRFPQSKDGPPIAAVLAAPLRVSGIPIGTLEVYCTDKTAWSEQDISLVESLAAQTSVSLEASRLFEDVSRERERFKTVLRTVPFGIGVCDAGCTDIRFNPSGAALFSVAADDNVAPQMFAWQLFLEGRPLSADQFPLVRACREGIEIVAEELELLAPGNRRLLLLCNARPIRDRESRVTGAVSAFVDITPQKELQRELDLRRREAEEASVRKTRFLAAVSHDIRTPANAISLLAELVKRTASNPAMLPEVPSLAQELYSNAMSLVGLLSDVLDIARFDSGKVELLETEFSLAEMLEEEHRQLLPIARDKGIALSWSAPGEPIRLRTDRIKLSRVLGNLIGNAIKFTDNGAVRIEGAVTPGDGVQLRVIDTGVGIAPEFQRHIFDEFFQLRNPERDRNKGIGLGLTICTRLVEAMGARIEVQSIVGQGSTFTITLPSQSFLNTPVAK